MNPDPPPFGQTPPHQWNQPGPWPGPPPPPPPRRSDRAKLLIAAAVVVVIALIGALAMTLSTGGSRPSTTAESTFQKAPGVGDCVEFSTLPSGTETTTVRSCSAVEATLQVTQTFPPADGETTGTCPKSEFSITSPTYTRGAARRSTGDFITCYQPNFREGQCYVLDAGQEQESSFANLRSVSCATGSLRVIRRVDGDATDAACRGLQGKYTIQNFTRPARTFCYAENK